MAAAILIIVAAMLAFSFSQQHGYLVLRDYNSGRVISRYAIEPGESFSVEFVHSVNKTPVRDIYVISEGGQIINTACVYYSFGAGVQTELSEGETLRYEDGAMIIENINKYYPSLIYSIMPQSTHILRVGGDEIFLNTLTGGSMIISIQFT